MIYIVSDTEEIERLKDDVKKEYLKALEVWIFCDKGILDTIESNLITDKNMKQLIKVYAYNDNIKLSRFEKITNKEDLYKWEKVLKGIDEFNFEQYEAIIRALDDSLLINAGAGTGKTRTAVGAVLNILLKEKANPNEVLMMTFTNNSTDDMYRKIYTELEKRYMLTFNPRCLYLLENIKELRICTIHNFFKSTIEDIGFIDGYSNNVNFGISTDKLKQYINSQVDLRFPNGEFNYREYGLYDTDIKNLIFELVMNENVNISSIEDYMFYNENSDSNNIRNIHRLVVSVCNKIKTEFMEELILEDKILLTDLNYRLNSILKYDFKFNKNLKQYKYIFIDECQDTSGYQFEVIKKIAGILGSKVFAVGDHMQAIYRFRSGNNKSMDNFKELTNTKPIQLIKNYRTADSILSSINRIFINLDENYTKLIPMEKRNDNRISKVMHNRENEDKIDKIKKIIEENEDRIKDTRKVNEDNETTRIAILTRTNNEAQNIYQGLIERGKHCTLLKGGELYKTKASKDLLALIRAVLYKDNYIAKVQLLNTEYVGEKINIPSGRFINNYDYEAIIDRYCDPIIRKFNLCYKCDSYKCNKNCEERTKQLNRTTFSILTDLINDIKLDEETQDIEYYKANILIILEELIKDGNLSTLVDIEQFLSLQVSSNEDSKSAEERDAKQEVIISTFHATKGLEFDTVIVLTDYDFGKQMKNILIREEEVEVKDYSGDYKRINLAKIGISYFDKQINEEVHTSYYEELKNKEEEDIVKDEINLLYVALTRSMEKLYVLMPLYSNDFNKKTHAELLKQGKF
ncbi:UvrD-helicase domain-containing protein [Romboutsia sp. 1001713B170131_170501_G6]|uniref:UvrD-helicase domain-containing protein n=1 Tax=Romboutsia sp. 1001713B170131_170501_G6 TaxID=2787108 RepID=UPI0018AB94CC|nr:UvrD-helicase domain-containing protein [Romboutsia sp. 1001713B170131_170501_G6]